MKETYKSENPRGIFRSFSRSANPSPKKPAAREFSSALRSANPQTSRTRQPRIGSQIPKTPLRYHRHHRTTTLLRRYCLPKHEVVRRLRFLKQPVTLFGEDDGGRLHRLSHVLEAGLFEVDSDLTEGQTNDFLRDIAELQKTGIVSDRKRQKTNAGAGARAGADEEDLKRMKANFEELCDEDKIMVFFKKLLNEQEQKLHEMPEAEKRTAEGKSEMARFNQCVRNLEPLFKLCRNKVLPDDVRHVLLFMVDCFMKRDYQAAMGYFLKLTIGNSP